MYIGPEMEFILVVGREVQEKPTYLQHVVEGKPWQEEVREEFGNAEHTIHHPVRQPLGIIFFVGTLYGFDAEMQYKSKYITWKDISKTFSNNYAFTAHPPTAGEKLSNVRAMS